MTARQKHLVARILQKNKSKIQNVVAIHELPLLPFQFKKPLVPVDKKKHPK